MSARWGSFLHTGVVQLKDHREHVGQWRDAAERPVPPPFATAGVNHVRAHIRDLIIVGSRPTVPPACHVETPSA